MKEENKIPKRKNNRIKDYDYSKEGYYFITICTYNRKETLSKIVGVDAHIDPQINLTSIGKIIEKYIKNYNLKNKNINIDDYVIMPNHIHLIIQLINGSMWASTPTISQIIKTLKILTTKEIGYSIWQRNYYEHIIRNEKEYLKIKEYIINNPINWKKDEYFNGSLKTATPTK